MSSPPALQFVRLATADVPESAGSSRQTLVGYLRTYAVTTLQGRGAMQQIADWLEKLGMSEYAERFAENEIDVSVLPHLTDQDLRI